MNDREHERVKDLFFAATRLEPDERARLLDGLEEETRREVESLLEHHEQETRERPTLHLAGKPTPPDAGAFDVVPRIPNFELLRCLGEGGMGVVYEAEQLRPVQRRVAVKLLKLGSVSAQMAARFDSERHVLALMNHPNIATVLDAGTTEEAQPFLVMELVDGVPITEYCDRNRLDVADRLRLLIQICEAVQHAHQKGIVHRDLKPRNVLVGELDGRPVPKVIDFGIAKLIRSSGAEEIVHTVQGQFFGTPAYMSPEQLAGSRDIDTRSDVYSLGLLLYELLTGKLPYESDTFDGGLDAMRRRLQGHTLPLPSDRLTSLGRNAAAIALARRCDVADLRRRLRTDLDWIAGRALEMDRERRYAAASDLAADLRRHLEHLPVLAGPPSLLYRVGKLARRNRVGVAAVGFGVLALVLGSIGTTVGLVRSREAESEARREARTAREVSGFLVDLFQVSQPSEALGESITAREILDRGASRIDEELDEEPLVQAELMSTIGTVYRGLGLYRAALPLFERALELRQRLLGNDHAATADSLQRLGMLLHELGRPRDAAPLLDQALASLEALHGPRHPAVASALGALAIVHGYGLGDYETAVQLQERALEIREETVPVDNPSVAESLTALGGLHFQVDDFEPAKHYFRRALEIVEAHLDPLHPEVAASLNNLAMVLIKEGSYDDALRLLRRTLGIAEKIYEPDHPRLAIALNNLAYAHRSAGDNAAAKPILERAIGLMETHLGPEHPELARALANMGKILRDAGELIAARSFLERALAIQETALGPESVDIGWTLFHLGILAEREERFDEAASHYRRALEIQEASFAPEHETVATTRIHLGRALVRSGKLGEAEPHLERAAEVLVGDDDRLPSAQVLFELAYLREKQGQLDEAEQTYRQALELRRAHLEAGEDGILSHGFRVTTVLEIEARLAGLADLRQP